VNDCIIMTSYATARLSYIALFTVAVCAVGVFAIVFLVVYWFKDREDGKELINMKNGRLFPG